MVQRIDAIYENGVLRPIDPLKGLPEHARVRVTVESATGNVADLADVLGALSDEAAAEMTKIVEDEFERVDPREWQ